jgi:hypothetical protein
MKSALIAIILTATLAIGIAGCGGSSSSCSSAMGHLYDMGCTIVVGGEATTRDDATKGCEDENDAMNNGTCACKSEFEATLNCLKNISQSDCTRCSSQFGALNTCTSTYCSS